MGREPQRRLRVDLLGQFGIEIAKRIIRQTRQMDDRVKSLQVGRGHVADILYDVGRRHDAVAKVAASKKIAVEAGHTMPRRAEHRDENRPYIAAMAGDEYVHVPLSHVTQGAFPDSQSASSFCLSLSVSMHCQNPACW